MDLNELNGQLSFDTTTKPTTPTAPKPLKRAVARRSKVTSVTLTTKHIEALKVLGEGNVSRGIKHLVNEHLKNNK